VSHNGDIFRHLGAFRDVWTTAGTRFPAKCHT